MTDSQKVDITTKLAEKLGSDFERVQEDYEQLYDWMIREGKDPQRERGYSEGTAENYMSRVDQLHRFILEYFDPEDVIRMDKEDANDLLFEFNRGNITKQRASDAGERYSDSALRKFSNALETYFNWLYYDQKAIDSPWDPEVQFADETGNSADRFTYRELGQLFEEAAKYRSLPSYHEVTDAERKKINGLVAQRIGIPKEEVTYKEWQEADWSNKVYSMVVIAFDAGLAPIEIANANINWYEPEQGKLRIPTEHACKQREKEVVGLSDEATEALDRWLKERRQLAKYDGTRKIWLNRKGNPYDSGNLCNLITTLCDEAGVPTENRKIVWYSLRHTLGRNITDEGSLSEANDQLRHDLVSTTQETYNETPIERRNNSLNEIHEKAEQARDNPGFNPYDDESNPTQSNTDEESCSSTDSEFSQKRFTDYSSNSVDSSETAQFADRSGSGRFTDEFREADHDAFANDETHVPPWKQTDEVVTQMGNELHVDAIIPDTNEAKVDVAGKILNHDEEE